MKTFLKFIKAEGSGIERAKSTVEILQEVLGLLKGQYWNYWTTHWQAKGENYYGNHLLFQRIYEGMQGEIDTLAEKIVGYFDENAVENSVIMEKMHPWFDQWNKISNPLDRAIQSEQDMQNLFKAAYEKLKKDDDISLGLDDFLMATANAHETNLYLLQQANKKLEESNLSEYERPYGRWSRQAAKDEIEGDKDWGEERPHDPTCQIVDKFGRYFARDYDHDRTSDWYWTKIPEHGYEFKNKDEAEKILDEEIPPLDKAKIV